MKTKFFTLLVLIAVAFTACKKEKSVDDLEVKSTPEDNSFKVTLKMVSKNDDNVAIFYSEDGTTNFSAEPIWHDLKANTAEQDVMLTLPESVYPTQLRIDTGFKPDVQEVALKAISFEYKGKKRDIAGPEIGAFFRADLTKCTFDPATGIIKPLTVDGKKQIPSLYPQEVALKAELEKLVQ